MGRLVILGGLLAWLGPGWWILPARGDEPLPTALAGLDEPTEGQERPEPSAAPSQAPWHEGLSATASGPDQGEGGPDRVAKSPPAAVAERPGAAPSKPGAQWLSGYWGWDKARKDYVWVTGTWQVPPAGKFWVNGYWRRDGRGWYRVPGFWSARTDGAQKPRPDWRKEGPPSSPEEDVGTAPGPDHFYVSGVYMPDPQGKGLIWKPGFWYPAQSGWDWVPARWVRKSSGWTFREGSWQRVEVATDDKDTQPAAARTAVPPGYPTYGAPRYGYGMPGGSVMGWISGFLNQVIP